MLVLRLGFGGLLVASHAIACGDSDDPAESAPDPVDVDTGAGGMLDPGSGGDDDSNEGGAVESNTYLVDLDTTVGTITIEVHPDWAPLGAARFRELVEVSYFDGSKFFRVVPNFVVQFGLAADPTVSAMWTERIDDDPVVESNTRGRVTFATSGANSRTTQLFINYGDNTFLDGMGFAPFGEVVEGTLSIAEQINAEYGEDPDQNRIRNEGDAYLNELFPNLTTIDTATIR
ncbi:MAG: peptidylprolyl isomerase [Myxococcota bacterium]